MLRVSSTPGNSTPLTWRGSPDNFLFITIDLNTSSPQQNNGVITIGSTPEPTPTPTATPQQLKLSLPTDSFNTSVDISTIIIEPVIATSINPGLNYIGFQGDFTF